ncbi:nucleoside triphosphatase [Weissella diestrammenae]|uniref:Nucleoside triphosphatase n=1 Tax=Weissella diestrammenae TaxID=1162633 RepID=A0A7G9T547_9LACO|nr:non-canonical purine NTP pyrophosphatase [Weissella diestrammenae]MCM0583078.1 nucleoside triphosphatase [Weissella diestrammenae]QNN75222.1 nucleoside triphosphatase [Weissella diestrammenae]
MTRVVIASNNTHKTKEILQYLQLFKITAVNYRDLHARIEFPVETTDNMKVNAAQKSSAIHQLLPDEFVLADDSALFVPAIPDHFGVTTMREFKSQQLKTDSEINRYVLAQLLPGTSRKAYLAAYFTLITPQNDYVEITTTGGESLAMAPRGNESGLDAIVMAENGLTLAEMSIAERIHYSHRGRAVIKLHQYLVNHTEWPKS